MDLRQGNEHCFLNFFFQFQKCGKVQCVQDFFSHASDRKSPQFTQTRTGKKDMLKNKEKKTFLNAFGCFFIWNVHVFHL